MKVYGTIYGQQDGNLDEKDDSMKKSPIRSPNKKRIKLGKKISPKISRKKPNIKTPLDKKETPELYRYFSRMKKKENEKKEERTPDEKEIQLKRKENVRNLLRKFEPEPGHKNLINK